MLPQPQQTHHQPLFVRHRAAAASVKLRRRRPPSDDDDDEDEAIGRRRRSSSNHNLGATAASRTAAANRNLGAGFTNFEDNWTLKMEEDGRRWRGGNLNASRRRIQVRIRSSNSDCS